MLELETRDTRMHYGWRVSWQRQCDALALVSFNLIVYPATKQKWYQEHFEDSVHLASNWYISPVHGGPRGKEGTFVFLTAFSLLGSWGRYAWLKAGPPLDDSPVHRRTLCEQWWVGVFFCAGP